jgi:hypothetical protein
MSDAVPPLPSDKVHQQPLLSYATPSKASRPKWVYFIAGIYLLLLTAIASMPFFLTANSDPRSAPQTALVSSIIVVLLFGAGLTLMLIPVRTVKQRPMTRRTIWIPILGSGILAGLLALAAMGAYDEYFYGEKTGRFDDLIFPAAIAAWLIWCVVFSFVAYGRSLDSVGNRLHHLLIAGSVLELLVAVPCHLVVRRRTECCAGIVTGMAICTGVVVMLIAFGPSVFLLYHRRYKQITGSGKTSRSLV